MWEIKISEFFYNPTSTFAFIFELIGEWPALIPFVYIFVVFVGILAKRRIFRDKKWELVLFSLYLVSVVVVASLVVLTIKNLWGRARFCELEAPTYEGYTPFYKLSSFGGESFPSGHASMSALSILLCDINNQHKIFDSNKGIVAFSVTFTILVILSRLIAGAHFITDLLVGVVISLATRFLLKKIYKKLYPKLLPNSKHSSLT